eukprot:c35933_g1_i1 orf=1-174(-)
MDLTLQGVSHDNPATYSVNARQTIADGLARGSMERTPLPGARQGSGSRLVVAVKALTS